MIEVKIEGVKQVQTNPLPKSGTAVIQPISHDRADVEELEHPFQLPDEDLANLCPQRAHQVKPKEKTVIDLRELLESC